MTVARRGAIVALVLLVAACTSGADDEASVEEEAVVPAVSATSATGTPLPALSQGATYGDPSLDVAYRDCLLDQGFDPQGVQVIVGGAGVPWWVKTGHNVPRGLHGHCLEAIGGAPTDNTSYGIPIEDEPDLTSLERVCGTLSFDGWQVNLAQYPTFDGELPEPVRSGLGVSPEADGRWLDGVVWRNVSDSLDRLLLIGERPNGSTPQTYAYADVAHVDGDWVGSAWGNCKLVLQQPGWEITSLTADSNRSPNTESMTIPILATEVACASGQPPGSRSVVEVVEETTEAVYVAVFVEQQWSVGGQTCPGNPAFTARIRLQQALGERSIVDISIYPFADLW